MLFPGAFCYSGLVPFGILEPMLGTYGFPPLEREIIAVRDRRVSNFTRDQLV